MAVKKQYFDKLARGTCFKALPEELHLERDPGSPHYDLRVEIKPSDRDVQWMAKNDVLLPVVCVVDEHGRNVVIDGRQRVLACVEANAIRADEGKPPLKLKVVTVDSAKRGDPRHLFEVRVVANAHRTPDDPIVEAKLMEQFIDPEGEIRGTVEEASALWGCTARTVYNKIALLGLCPELVVALREGRITETAARPLAELSRAEQLAALATPPKASAGKVHQPTKRVFKIVTDHLKGLDDPRLYAVAAWARGEISEDAARRAVPELREAFKAAKKAPKKKRSDSGKKRVRKYKKGGAA